jgi:serine/threonine protein kinase/tetratricopeptide (TPR) repeat protein
MKRSTSHSQNLDGGGSVYRCAVHPPPNDENSVCTTQILKSSQRDLIIGSIIAGRYQVIEKLGKGGMGEVYKVLDKEINEKVALKLLNPNVADDEKTIERFRSELKYARQISHRNVCRMYDLNKEEESYYITMEYVAGEDLKGSIRRMGPLHPAKAVFIAKQVCEGLAEAHRLGIVHRDLKPQNIMIDGEGNARIMDFGIARSLKTKGITETGVIIGTPEYMSVEQVEGKEVDHRSDLYSLGIILYEMLTSALPFNGDTPLSVALKHKTDWPSDPREINPQIPEDLSRLIFKCLEKDREKRFESAEELICELDQIEKDFSTTQTLQSPIKPSTSKEITLTVKREKLLIPALIFAAMVIAGVFVWRFHPRSESFPLITKRPSLAVMSFSNNSGDESLDYWQTGLVDLLITDLGQSKFLQVISGNQIYNLSRKLNLLDAKEYSAKDLVRVATVGKIDYILNGSFFTGGSDFTVVVTLGNPRSGRIIGSHRIDFKTEEEIPVKIDGLTKKIKSDLGLSTEQISGDMNRQLEKMVTSSSEAYRYYIDGWNNSLRGGDPQKTIESLEKAITLDPKFARAYTTLAEAYGRLGLLSEQWNFLQKALELKDGLTNKEFYLAQAKLYSMSEETYSKAVKAYQKVLRIYPEDYEANFNLGTLYGYDLEEWDKAVERFDVLIQNRAESGDLYMILAEAYMATGRYDKAKTLLENYLSRSPDEDWIRAGISQVYLCQGQSDSALSEAEEALSNDSASLNPLLVGDIYHCRGDFKEAEREYGKIFNTQELTARYDARSRLAALYLSQGRFERSNEQFRAMNDLADKAGDTLRLICSHYCLAQSYLSSGNPEKALEEWKEGWNMAMAEGVVEQSDLFLEGRIYLEMKSTNEALQVAQELKKMLQTKKNQKLIRYYQLLAGMISMEKGDLTEAISNLSQAAFWSSFQHSVLDDHALFIYPLAVAYYKAGDLEKAQEQFQKIISLTTGRMFFGDMYSKSYYLLGKIYQEKGWGEKAIKHYVRFLELWKDADAQIPEIEDAQKRLAQLKTPS